MKGETMGIVTELRSTCETKLPHIKTKKANENKEILNLKSYIRHRPIFVLKSWCSLKKKNKGHYLKSVPHFTIFVPKL